jgi:hypothetical protein
MEEVRWAVWKYRAEKASQVVVVCFEVEGLWLSTTDVVTRSTSPYSRNVQFGRVSFLHFCISFDDYLSTSYILKAEGFRSDFFGHGVVSSIRLATTRDNLMSEPRATLIPNTKK